MKNTFIRTFNFVRNVKNKIAFYPTLFSILGLFGAIIMMIVEQTSISNDLKKLVPMLVLENGDTALTILGVCIGGLISMMVFSFSMVMLLLSQASSNFSPRLLPGLVSDKKHQVILGTYLATILYNIFILFSVEPSDSEYTLPGLSILIGILLTIVCLIAFIYFIHTMSQNIQINNILDTIFDKSVSRLKTIIENENENSKISPETFRDTSKWHVYSTHESGYFQNVSLKNLMNYCEEHDNRIYITKPLGMFVLRHTEFIKTKNPLDEKTLSHILSNINFSRGELVEENYILAFKQITEITVKAMSPGINDPGTAINAIDYLTELFALRMKKTDTSYGVRNGATLIKVATVDFQELLYMCMASLRAYCKHDVVIVQKLIWMLRYLQDEEACDKNYIAAVNKEMEELLRDAKEALTSDYDIKTIEALAATDQL